MGRSRHAPVAPTLKGMGGRGMARVLSYERRHRVNCSSAFTNQPNWEANLGNPMLVLQSPPTMISNNFSCLALLSLPECLHARLPSGRRTYHTPLCIRAGTRARSHFVLRSGGMRCVFGSIGSVASREIRSSPSPSIWRSGRSIFSYHFFIISRLVFPRRKLTISSITEWSGTNLSYLPYVGISHICPNRVTPTIEPKQNKSPLADTLSKLTNN